jgi:peroxiredoxin
MTGLQRIWKAGPLIIAMLVIVPGVLMLFLQRGYLAGGIAAPALPMSSLTVVAPDFSLPDLDGNVRRLASFRSRVVLLTFWTAWCPPCQSEMPQMEELYQAYRRRGFEIVAVVSDGRGADVAQPFANQHRPSFTILQDATGQVARLYGVTSLPTTYLLDRHGRLALVAVGSRDWTQADSRAAITSLLDSASMAIKPPGMDGT